MASEKARDAWVSMPDEAQLRTLMPRGNPYDFGFLPAMGRLVMTHSRIAPFFAALFGQVMFTPGTLSRREREMVAAVATAAQDCHY
jgi:alkylhydroperoxidase/carboxymuconolactone decarboxylase family protein YurZ